MDPQQPSRLRPTSSSSALDVSGLTDELHKLSKTSSSISRATGDQTRSVSTLPSLKTRDSLLMSSLYRSSSNSALRTTLQRSNLSLKLVTNTEGEKRKLSDAKLEYEALVRRLYYQITVGCGKGNCRHKLCRSNPSCVVKLDNGAAMVLAFQLAARPTAHKMICPNCPEKAVAHENESKKDEEPSRKSSFLVNIFSMSPFRSVFQSPATSSHSENETNSLWRKTKSLLDLPSLFSQPLQAHKRSSPLANSAASLSELLLYDSPYQTPTASPTSTPSMSRSTSRDFLFGRDDDSYEDGEEYLPSLDASTLRALVETITNPNSIPASDMNRSGSGLSAELTFEVESELHRSQVRDALLKNVKRLFSSQEAMCTSFLADEAHDEATEFISDFKRNVLLGVDFTQVRKSYDMLLQQLASHGPFQESLMNAQGMLLARLELSVHKWHLDKTPARHRADREERIRFVLKKCRQLLIVMENPALDIPNYRNSIFKQLCLVFASLKGEIKALLVPYLAKGYSAEYFEKTVNRCKLYISENFRQNPSPKESIVGVVRFLSFLYSVNEHSSRYRSHEPLDTNSPTFSANISSHRTIVPYTLFYSYDTASPFLKINLKDEFMRWRKLSQNPQQLTSVFSYLNYPFLFDASLKAKIMRIESVVNMTGEFEDAYVQQAYLTQAQKVVDLLEQMPGPTMASSQSRNATLSSNIVQQIFSSSTPSQNSPVEQSPDVSNATDMPQRTLTRTNSHLPNLEDSFKVITSPYLVLNLRREFLLEDTLATLIKRSQDLYKPLKVRFIGEDGIDQGGVQKEFFQMVFEKLMEPAYGLFTYDKETRLSWLNPFTLNDISQYELVGMLMGLAVYNGVIIDVQLPEVFYKRLLWNGQKKEELTLDDIVQLNPNLHRGLYMLRNWNEEQDGGTVEDIFCRYFEISYEGHGHVKTFPLVNNGENIPVTSENRMTYIQLYVQHILDTSISSQFQHLRKGFWKVVGQRRQDKQAGKSSTPFVRSFLKIATAAPRSTDALAITLFRPEECMLLLTGTANGLNDTLFSSSSFEALKQSTRYEDFSPDEPYIKSFWRIVLEEFSDNQRRKLLWFVTASDRVPLGGYKEVAIVIQKNGPDSDRLPTALTCFSRLLLPTYSTGEKLKKFLSLAIEESKGFGLL